MPSRGAWLEFEHDANNNVLNVHIDRNRKLPVTILLRGILHNSEVNGNCSGNYIAKMFEYDPVLALTFVKDDTATDQESLVENLQTFTSGEIPTDESVQKTLNDLLFDAKRYDLARVGRYKFNKKLSLATRIEGLTLGCDLEVALMTFAKYTCLSREQAELIAKSGVVDTVKILNADGITVELKVSDSEAFTQRRWMLISTRT